MASDHDLTQIHTEARHEKNILDLMFTWNPSLSKSSSSIPGIYDHAITISDFDIRPHYTETPKKENPPV